MGKLFSLDNPVIALMARVADIVVLNLLWLLCCIPIVTIGTSTTALYYVTLKMVKNEDSGILRSFFHAIKDNLKQGILLTLIFLVCGFVLLLDYFAVAVIGGFVEAIGQPLVLLLAYLLVSTALFAIPLQAQFSNTIRGTLKAAFILSFQKFSNTLFVVVLNVLVFAVFALPLEICLKVLPIWMLIVPSAVAYICSGRFVKIFDPLIQSAECEE